MHQIKRVLRIPKDPRTEDMVFLTQIPYDLLNRMTQDEWHEIVDGLNRVMLQKEKSSFWSLLRILFIIPAALHIDTYDTAVRTYLKRVNDSLRSRGVYIEDPSLNGYTELEVMLVDNEPLNAH